MRFKVSAEDLTWGGKEYQRGDVIEIPEGHPRLDALVWSKQVIYDATSPANPDAGKPVVVVVSS